jgi:H+-transporting ATPase
MGIDLNAYRQVSYTPFNPSIKRTEAIFESGEKRVKGVKGAAQIVISMCKGLDRDRNY